MTNEFNFEQWQEIYNSAKELDLKLRGECGKLSIDNPKRKTYYKMIDDAGRVAEELAKEYLEHERVFEVNGDRDDLVIIMKERETNGEFEPLFELIDYYHGKPEARATLYYYLKWKEGKAND